MTDDEEKRLRDVEGDLKAHLRECLLQNKVIWHELRGQRKILWTAVFGIICTLLAVCGVLLKFHLKL